MSAPKIKLYRLYKGFVSDDLAKDMKLETNDELLPVKDKYIVPSEIIQNRKATGIIPHQGMFLEELIPFEPSQITGTLSLDDSNSESNSQSESINSGIYSITAEGYDINPVLSQGFYPVVYIGLETVPASGYKYEDGKIIASDDYRQVVFTHVKFYNKVSGSSNSFSSKYCPVYNGNNDSFKPYLIKLKNGIAPSFKSFEGYDYEILNNHVTDMEFFKQASDISLSDGDYFIDYTTGEITTSEVYDIPIYLAYVAVAEYARTYIAESNNLIPPNEQSSSGGHLYMGPDVFVGLYRYEPNSYEDIETGQIVTMGDTPRFVETSYYSISYRDGSVTFATEFNSNQSNNLVVNSTPQEGLLQIGQNLYVGGNVFISYANIAGICNTISRLMKREYGFEDQKKSEALDTALSPSSNSEEINSEHVNNYNLFSINYNGEDIQFYVEYVQHQGSSYYYPVIKNNSDGKFDEIINVNSVAGHWDGDSYIIEFSYDDEQSNSSSDNSIGSFTYVDDARRVSTIRTGDVIYSPDEKDYRYINSYDCMWVGRNNTHMPRNVYSTRDGESGKITELKPNIITVDPYDELTIKMS